MKHAITLISILLISITGFSQIDRTVLSNQIVPAEVERTPELEQLFAEAKVLETTGTAAEINANRLAIKEAWMAVSPEIAALYKPVDNGGALPETMENLAINGIYFPDVIKERDAVPQIRDWDTDRLLLDEFVDGGVDIEVTQNGDIYISAFQNNIEFGGDFDIIFIYRSLDGGQTFQQWQAANVTAPMRKMQIISMDGDGDDYLLAYLYTESGNFQVWRWNMDNGNFDAQVISGDVSDFSVDRNYPVATNAQQVFATYQKMTTCTEVHSARSTVGSYGFDWVDEVSESNTCGEQVDFTYGLNGVVYTTYTGATSGSLYANVNSDYNDPTSWGARETIELGGGQETINPTIAAARNSLASDKVIIWASQRDAGTSDSFDGIGYLRENEGTYALFSNFASGGSNWNIAHTDSWVRKVNGTEVIRTAYVRDNIDNSENDLNRSLTFNGTGFDIFEQVADTDIDVFDGFPSATAETDDQLPCMAFAGTSGGGSFGYGLYFDAKTEILGTQDNIIEGLSYYPNPANEVLNIHAENNIDTIALYSLLGQEVLKAYPDNREFIVNTASLTSGIYVMEIRVNGQTETYKIIKE
ncbi:T9SS type A sorting domain-containing protein [Marixanthomonas ophiurae]|uniref:T9SS C-terminal target domain-containing protein n=1 Tax=Marixanthomonas ophiurae TaxID=387659 RepID=A0A3E1Q9V2_9FLAO|nr:T9SS type A sorting domain-containing protein [Marixanthomonas ophiurae]RFN58910.1 T9SS C-terminal target domain-containing protein [Marixanthomonas ophiurae]